MKPKLKPNILIIVLLGMAYSINAQNKPNWDQITFSPDNDYHPRWDHKGSMIAYTHSTSTETEIWIIDPDEKKPSKINTGLEGDKHISWSPHDDIIAFDARDKNGRPNIFIVSLEEEDVEQLTFNTGFHPVYSPDKNQIAFSSFSSGNIDIWIMNVGNGESSRLTYNKKNDYHPCWSHDGKYIAFTSERSGNPDIWVIPADGGTPSQITHSHSKDDWASWAPDDSYLIYSSKRSGNYDLWVTALACKKSKQLTYSKSNENHPELSPEGKRLAFSSDKSGSLDIWIMNFK